MVVSRLFWSLDLEVFKSRLLWKGGGKGPSGERFLAPLQIVGKITEEEEEEEEEMERAHLLLDPPAIWFWIRHFFLKKPKHYRRFPQEIETWKNNVFISLVAKMGESSVRPRLPFNFCSSLELDPPISAAEGGGPTSKLSCNKREGGRARQKLAFFVCTYPATRQKVGREKVFSPSPRSQKESFKFANCPSPPPLFPHGLALKMEGWGRGGCCSSGR